MEKNETHYSQYMEGVRLDSRVSTVECQLSGHSGTRGCPDN